VIASPKRTLSANQNVLEPRSITSNSVQRLIPVVFDPAFSFREHSRDECAALILHSFCMYLSSSGMIKSGRLLGQSTVLVTSFPTLLSSLLSSFLVSAYRSVGTLAVVLVNLPNPWSDLVPVWLAYASTGQGGLTIILASILGLSTVSGWPDISLTPRGIYRSRRQGGQCAIEETTKKKKKRRKRTCKFRYPRQFPQ